jgi:hypothetical protein
MGQSVSQVDTVGLAKIGSAVQRTSAGFAAAHTSRAAALTSAGTMSGWATGGALDGAATTWGAFFQQLTTQAEAVGADLTRSAEEFRAADAAAGNRVTVAGHSPVRLF